MIAYPSKILVTVTDARQAPTLLALARAILGGRDGRIVVLGLVTLTSQATPADSMRAVRATRRSLAEAGRASATPDTEIKSIARVAADRWKAVLEMVEQERADLLLLSWQGTSGRRTRVLGKTLEWAVQALPCDLVLARPGVLTSLQSILLPLRGGPSAELGVRLAEAMARSTGAALTLMHVDREDARPAQRVQDRLLFNDLAATLSRDIPLRRKSVAAPSVADAIVRESEHHQVVVLGAPLAPEGPAQGDVAGIPEVVAAQSRATVLVTRSRVPVDRTQFSPKAASLPTLVRRWFAEQSFHAREFSDLGELVALKERQRLTVGLAIPTRNDASTIGTVLRTLKRELVERCSLLDQIVVLDLGSEDDTLEIARLQGVEAARVADILPEFGGPQGYGDAVWKSQWALNTDIITWIQADIKNIHPKFIYGVVGPLLRHEELVYVKGFYQTPARQGEATDLTGGGRLTELVARPLLNLFFPELAGFVEPLSREHAIRRSALERLAVFSGDGADLSLLMDVLYAHGLHALAQSELEERIYRAQPLAALGPHSLALLHAIMVRMETRGKARVLVDPQATLNMIRQREGEFCLETVALQQVERPPKITLSGQDVPAERVLAPAER